MPEPILPILESMKASHVAHLERLIAYKAEGGQLDGDPTHETIDDLIKDAKAEAKKIDDPDLKPSTKMGYGITGAYYLDPEVRRRLGYEGQVPQPVVASVFPEYVEEGLLDPVLASWAR